jgi:outer membrane protein assembly factor BamB
MTQTSPKAGSKSALVLAGDFSANFYAIDSSTGKLVWSKFTGTDQQHHMITGGAQFYGNKLFKSHGMLQALDPYTDNIVWTHNTAPNATGDISTHKYGPNGTSIWTSVSAPHRFWCI